MRFSATEVASGWWKLTVLSGPMLNDCQFSETFCDAWLMSKVLPLTTPVAWPAPTQLVTAGTGRSPACSVQETEIASPPIAPIEPRFFFMAPKRSARVLPSADKNSAPHPCGAEHRVTLRVVSIY